MGLLHELALRADTEEDLQQHGAQQLLWSDAGAPALDVSLVHAGKQVIHLDQRFVDHRADGVQWMVCRNEVLELAHGEQTLGEGVGAARGLGSVLK